MVKVNIISGFLGAGKTTLIKKLLSEVYAGEKIAIIENEFGEIGIDGGLLKNSGIEIKEMNSGCICCSLVGDFSESLKEMTEKYRPDRIIIEPTGVGKLSDVVNAVKSADEADLVLDACITVADVSKCKMYSKNFGEFYNNQIENASCILLTRIDKASEEKIRDGVALIKTINHSAPIITTPLSELSPETLLSAIKGSHSLLDEILEAHRIDEEHSHHHGEGEHCHDDEHEHHECCHEESGEHHHHHEHNHGEEEHRHDECAHEHEHHDEHGHEHEHHHHHHGKECSCGHHHHHGHDADEAFTSFGAETPNIYTKDEIENALSKLDGGEFGAVLRGKGIVQTQDGWISFDYVPEEVQMREASPDYTGRICIIGANLVQDKLKELFRI